MALVPGRYAVSFLLIGTVWANHHNRFRLVRRSERVLLFLNIIFLMRVAFLSPPPFSQTT